jgi:hypothetical protein
VNNIQIYSGQETLLYEGNLIGICVSEKMNSDCCVFQLCRKFFKVMQLQLSCL